jgi:hypothetical protein
MTFELWIAITGALIALGGTIPQLLEKFYHLPPRSPEDEFEIKKGKRAAIISFFIVLLGASISFLSSVKSISDKTESELSEKVAKEKAQQLNDSLLNSQARLITLSTQQLDNTSTVLSLSERLNKAQQDLSDAQQSMIDLQNSSFEKLSGGSNRPTLNINSLITFNRNDKYPNKRVQHIGITNSGKTFLKEVEVSVYDIYKGIDKLEEEKDSSFVYRDENGQINKFMYNPSANLSKFSNVAPDNKVTQVNLGTVAPKSMKTIYNGTSPQNSNLINYTVLVNWSNGSYLAHIYGKYDKYGLCIKHIDYYDSNRLIKNELSYFGIKKINPSDYMECESISYKNDSFNVYWSPSSHFVKFRRQGSIYLNAFNSDRAKNKIEASNVLLSKMIELFGK